MNLLKLSVTALFLAKGTLYTFPALITCITGVSGKNTTTKGEESELIFDLEE